MDNSWWGPIDEHAQEKYRESAERFERIAADAFGVPQTEPDDFTFTGRGVYVFGTDRWPPEKLEEYSFWKHDVPQPVNAGGLPPCEVCPSRSAHAAIVLWFGANWHIDRGHAWRLCKNALDMWLDLADDVPANEPQRLEWLCESQ